jgi:hypothetical protein
MRRLNRSPDMRYPDGVIRVVWDCIMAATILFECIALPFLLVTDNLKMQYGQYINEVALRIVTCIEITCIVDLALNLNIGIFAVPKIPTKEKVVKILRVGNELLLG